MSALQPLAPIQPVNFPSDRGYTHNALIEELVLIERHLRDESWRLCRCNPEKHLPAIAALGSEGQGFSETDEEREFMRKLQVRARLWREKIKSGKFTERDADQLRALVREFRHRIEFQTWSGPMEETPELVDVVQEIHALTGDIPSLEEKQVEEIITKLSDKHGIPRPKYRFINNCNPLKDAFMVGSDAIIKDENGKITRVPLTDSDQLVFCRGGASAYTIAHEWCHYRDRIKTGITNEKTATECALRETGNNEKSVYKQKRFYTLDNKKRSGGIMSALEGITEKIGVSLPLVGGVIIGSAIEQTGIIDNTIASFTGGFTGLAKGIIGALVAGTGFAIAAKSKNNRLVADLLIGAGASVAASGITQQFFPGGVTLGRARATTVMPVTTTAPVRLTSFARPTGLRMGHPTLAVPMIPPRPGILAPSMIPADLAGKFILGNR